MAKYEVWDTVSQTMVFITEDKPDLVTAITDAKALVARTDLYASLNPAKLLVCLVTGKSKPSWTPPKTR